MWRIERYTESDSQRWDEFVDSSRNGTFLFRRGYMDYHSDRFCDCSWMVSKGERLVALLPANLTADGVLQSHGGLTYGGWILPQSHIDGSDILEIFSEATGVWRDMGIRTLDYKPVPHIYCRRPSDEDLYALFRLGATVTECNLSATADLTGHLRFNKLQKRHLAGCGKLDISVEETDDICGFMAMLEVCLQERHGTSPVHTAAEMELLKSRFPDRIRFFVTKFDGELHAGVCIYDTGLVAHAQYIATTPLGRELNLLTPLFHKLMAEVYSDRRYFDFGISNENHGRYLNSGLLRQKYSYGATGSSYIRCRLDLCPKDR